MDRLEYSITGERSGDEDEFRFDEGEEGEDEKGYL
jgi:hypothetical protein